MIIRLKKDTHLRFYVLLTALILLLFLRYALQIDIPRIVLTLTIAITAFLGTRNEILAIAMCCIPLHEAVDVFYSVVACAAAYVVKNPKRIHIGPSVILLFGMVVWELLHSFSSGFSIMGFLVKIIPLIFVYVILYVDISDIDYGFAARIMAVIVVVMCITLLGNLYVNSNYNLAEAISGLRRLGIVSEEEILIGGAINPNALGIISVLGLTSLFQLRIVGENKKSDMVLMIVLLIFGVLTSSRTFLVCLLLMAVLLILGQKGTLAKKMQFIIALLLISVMVLILLNRIFPDLMEYYIGRFSMDDITTGRLDLMQVYHKFITENPRVMFFGIGLQDYSDQLKEMYRIASNIPHNSIQEIIIAWGIPGLMMVIALIAAMIMKSRKYCPRHTLLNGIPLLIILAKSMAGQLLTSPYTILTLAFAYLSLAQNFQSEQKSVPGSTP